MDSLTERSRGRSGRARRLRAPHPDALELVADLLLESAGQDDEYPAYSEDDLLRRGQRSHRGRRLDWSRYTCTNHLLAAEIDDLSRSAPLTRDEDVAWRMSIEGSVSEEIAEMLGTTRTRAVRLLVSAKGRIASCDSKVRGLHSAYLSLVGRHGYHPVECQW